MLAAAGIVFLGAIALLVLAWRAATARVCPSSGENERANMGLVVAFGMVIPGIVLIVLFIVANLVRAQRRPSAPAADARPR